MPFELGEYLHKSIAGSKLIKFDHSGHGLFYDEKDKFNQELVDYDVLWCLVPCFDLLWAESQARLHWSCRVGETQSIIYIVRQFQAMNERLFPFSRPQCPFDPPQL